MATTQTLKTVIRRVFEFALSTATFPFGVSRTVNGTRYRLDSRTRQSFTAAYDPGATQVLASGVPKGGTCWNVGANVGVHTLQLASLVGSTGRVLAFEPNPNAAKLLRRNIHLNGFGDRVQVVESAVGQKSGEIDFFVEGASPMGRGGKPNPGLAQTHRIRVPVTTLDELVRENASRPDCIVVDIEGWEIGALMGSPRLLDSDPLPLLIVELHPEAWPWSGNSKEELQAVLKKHRLSLVALSGQKDVFEDLGQVLITRTKAS